MMASWKCPLCSSFGALSMKRIIRHIGSVHAHNAGFQVCCGIDGCPRTYTMFQSYRQHLYRHHRETLDAPPRSNSSELLDPDIDIEIQYSSDNNSEDSDKEENTTSILSKKEAGLFLLKAKELYKISELSMESLVSDISTIVESTMKHLEDRVQDVMAGKGISMTADLQQIFKYPEVPGGVFTGLHTTSLRNTFIKGTLNLVVS